MTIWSGNFVFFNLQKRIGRLKILYDFNFRKIFWNEFFKWDSFVPINQDSYREVLKLRTVEWIRKMITCCDINQVPKSQQRILQNARCTAHTFMFFVTLFSHSHFLSKFHIDTGISQNSYLVHSHPTGPYGQGTDCIWEIYDFQIENNS